MDESGHELWASVGVRLPLDEKDEGDSLENLSMAFCTFLVKFVGKGYLFFSELCFLIPSESPLTVIQLLGNHRNSDKPAFQRSNVSTRRILNSKEHG